MRSGSKIREMSSIVHSKESEAEHGAEDPTRALKTASDFKHAIDGHAITVVADTGAESSHVNGTSCYLNTTIIPFPDGGCVCHTHSFKLFRLAQIPDYVLLFQ